MQCRVVLRMSHPRNASMQRGRSVLASVVRRSRDPGVASNDPGHARFRLFFERTVLNRCRVSSALAIAVLTLSCGPSEVPIVEVFHGESQRVGHLGLAQPDFNLMGRVTPARAVRRVTYSVNDGEPTELSVGNGRHGFGDGRRLGSSGDFNADIPIESLLPGPNRVKLAVTSRGNDPVETEVLLNRETGASPLPVDVIWRDLDNPQDVGQYVDGRWLLDSEGLRTAETGYDRLFLLGDTAWRDYELSVPVKIHRVDSQTGPNSGANGLGIIMRFAGHVNGGPRNFAVGQPKWGYQPFGAIAWLRWISGSAHAPVRQFYRGDGDSTINFGEFPVVQGLWYRIKVRAESLPEEQPGMGSTRYSFKIWREDESEPNEWDWQTIQESLHALRRGGAALVAHHVDVTFGDIAIVSR